MDPRFSEFLETFERQGLAELRNLFPARFSIEIRDYFEAPFDEVIANVRCTCGQFHIVVRLKPNHSIPRTDLIKIQQLRKTHEAECREINVAYVDWERRSYRRIGEGLTAAGFHEMVSVEFAPRSARSAPRIEMGEMLDRDLESRRQRHLASRIEPERSDPVGHTYNGVRKDDRGVCIGSMGGIVLDIVKKRGPLCKVLFEARAQRLGFKTDYATECIKWLGNE